MSIVYTCDIDSCWSATGIDSNYCVILNLARRGRYKTGLAIGWRAASASLEINQG